MKNYAQKLLLSFILIFFTQVTLAMNPCEQALQKVDDGVWGAKLLNQFKAYDFQGGTPTVGIEVEGVLAGGKSYFDILKAIKSEVQKQYPDEHVVISGFNGGPYVERLPGEVNYFVNGKAKRIQVKKEVAIAGPFDSLGLEVTSPIIESKEEMKFFIDMIQSLQTKVGFKPKPSKAGIHVHVGMTWTNVSAVLFLTQLFAEIEDQLFEKFSVNKKRKKLYAQSMKKPAQNLPAVVELANLDMYSLIERFDTEYGRNQALNLSALERFSTVEFRLFNSTTNAEEIMAMAEFSMAIVQAVRAKDPKLIQFLSKQQADKPINLEELSHVLGLEWDKKDAVFQRIHNTAFKESLKQKVFGLPALTSVLASSTVGLLLYQMVF